MRGLRWLLLVPGVIAAWYATFILGVVAYAVLERAACPPADWRSGTCYNSEVDRLLESVSYAFVALSAVAVVVAAALIAPSRTNVVAWSAYAVGGVAACILGVAGEAPVEALAALGSGLVAAIATTTLVSRQPGRVAT